MAEEERQAPQGLELVRHVADLLDSQASYDEAETLYREVLAARERTLGKTDAKTLGAAQSLGASLMRAGKLGEATELLRQCLARCSTHLGEQHSGTLAVKSSLVDLLGQGGDQSAASDEAMRLAREVVDVRRTKHSELVAQRDELVAQGASMPSFEAELSELNLTTLEAMNSLATVLEKREEPASYAEAVGLLREVVAGHRQALGDRHPKTVTCMANLGNALMVCAEQLEPLTRGRFCPDHLTSMPACTQSTGALEEAFRVSKEALACQREILGPHHPSTLGTLNNLATLYHATGDVTAACEHLNAAAEGLRKELGAEHQHTLAVLGNIGVLEEKLGNLEASEAAWRECFTGRRAKLGMGNSKTLTALHNLARICRARGKLVEAAECNVEMLEGMLALLGDGAGQNGTTVGCISALLELSHELADESVGKIEMAERLVCTALAAARKCLGDRDDRTITCMKGVVVLLRRQGKDGEAAPLVEEIRLLEG